MVDHVTNGQLVMQFINNTVGKIIVFASTTEWLFGLRLLDWALLILFSNIIFRFIKWWFIMPSKNNVKKQWYKNFKD